jgi:hypothetical protein
MEDRGSTFKQLYASQFPASEEPLVLESLFALSPKSNNKSEVTSTPKKESKQKRNTKIARKTS